MDAATAAVLAKIAIVFLGLAVFLRVLVREYARMGEAMADDIARVLLAAERAGRADGSPKPRVTLSPASDDAAQPGAS